MACRRRSAASPNRASWPEIFGVIQQPFIAAVLFVGLIYLFLIPPVHFRAMIDPKLYALMNWLMIGDGILFWTLVLDPRPKAEAGISYGMRMVLPFAVMFPQIGLGAYIAFTPHDIYPYYDLCGRLFPRSARCMTSTSAASSHGFPPA